MVETMLAVPFLFLLGVGILTFGFVLFQREQITTGLRDATRYLARCRTTLACDANIARNIAFYGNVAGTGPLRVPGWGPDASDITFTYPGNTCTSTTIPMSPTCAPVVRATTVHQLIDTPLYGALRISAITVRETHEQRNIGW